MIQLMPPITSSSEGTGPSPGHIPFKTYNGEVPMSLYMIPAEKASSYSTLKKAAV